MRDACSRQFAVLPADGLTTNTHIRNAAASLCAAVARETCACEGARLPLERRRHMFLSHDCHSRGRCVREFVCSYRPLRDDEGQVVQLPSVALSNPKVAASTLAPLLGGESVEVFAVACLSTRHRLLAWHVLSRGTRQSTPVSLPDVFVPACLTPGTTALLVVHNHPSGDPTPSADDARLTVRLAQAADVLDMPLLDHLIVGDDGRYFSFREAGLVKGTPPNESRA